MPILSRDNYKPNIFFRNGDINSIYPALFRKPPMPSYHRIRVDTLDDDFLDIDTVFSNNSRLAIICHGLEGSSHSQYMLSVSSILSNNGFDVIAMNFRSCSGEVNRQLRMYHSGETGDLNFIIQNFESAYDSISLIGYSMGGNVILKYLGEDPKSVASKIKNAAAISVPCDLSAGVKKLMEFRNKIYEYKFLKTLQEKVKLKHEMYPDNVDISLLKKVKTVWDYDDLYTGPIHGFEGAEDYYSKSNSKQFLHNIDIPTLFLAAYDDPFLPKECYPEEIARVSKNLHLLTTKYGGHVGFTTSGDSYYWSDRIILQFLNTLTI